MSNRISDPFDSNQDFSIKEGDLLLWEYAPNKFTECKFLDISKHSQQIEISYSLDNTESIRKTWVDPDELFYP